MKKILALVTATLMTLLLSVAPASATKHREAVWTADYMQPVCVETDNVVQAPVKVVRPSTQNYARFKVNWMLVSDGSIHTKTVKFYGNTGYYAITFPANDAILFNVERMDGTRLVESGFGGSAFCP